MPLEIISPLSPAVVIVAGMILSREELRSLVGLTHQSPHTLLGMHPLGDGAGLVVRAMLPAAAKVEIQPTHEKDKPAFELKRIPKTDVFEGVTKLANKVYAYDLVITDRQGRTRRTRDPFSFLPTLGESDLFLFGKGDERRIYDKLGAQLRVIDGVPGASFAVWAPNARRVSVVGDFNQWDGRFHPMRLLGASGVWEIFIPGVGTGAHYKFEIHDARGKIKLNTDPFGFFFEVAPKNAAIVCDTRQFKWKDQAWLEERSRRDALRLPMSIYEVHIGSWQKKTATESWSYRELAEPLVEYVRRLGFTHVESVVGVSGHRLLRAHQPLRHAGGFPVPRQRAARGGHRCDCGLGARAFPARRVGAGKVRRHGALRARRPAPGRAQGLGHAHFQFWPERGGQFPRRQRPVLARPVSH
jgi:1,4-alpha-glucan branching enzyme